MAKILLVEDDNNLREIYEARLQAEGYTIVSAQDGEEALVKAKQEKPDLVISDVMMPRISGFEMLDILRNTEGLKDTKVIMLTALGQAEDKTRADALGADRYLVKSQVTLEDIVKAADELLGGPEGSSDTAAAAPVASTPVNNTTAVPTTPTVAPVAVVTAPPAEPTAPAATPVEAPQAASEPVAAPAAPEPSTAAQPAVEPVVTAPAIEEATAVPEQKPATAAESPVPITATETANPPAASTAVEQATEAAAETQNASSAADEQALMQKQIDSFIQQQGEPTTPETPTSEPTPTAETPAPVSEPFSSETPADSVVVPAPPLDETANPSDSSETTPATNSDTVATIQPTESTPQPEPETTGDPDSVAVAGKKIIQPPVEPVAAQPDLNELLAKEGISSLEDHNPGPQAGPYTTPHQPGHVISPNGTPAAGLAPDDPNNIAL